MSVQQFRERVNLRIYRSKSFALGTGRLLNALVSFITLCSLIYYHGFPQTPESKDILITIVQGSFAFYIFNYLLSVFYSFEPLQLIRDTWFEGVLMLFLVIEGLHYNLTDSLLLSKLFVQFGISNIHHYYAIFIQVYFLGVILVKLIKTTEIIPNIKIHPNYIFIFTFLAIIFSGTGLLMLPEMTTVKGSIPFIDALFTATSATCVTGLSIYDTPTYFTFKGQIIIMLLIKLGGLNIIAFGSFLALASKFGVGVKQHSTLEDFVNRDSILSSKGLLGKVITWSLCIELIGSALLFLSWSDEIPFRNTGDRVLKSVFHALSAFNNAGFSLFTDGMYNPMLRENYSVYIILAVLIFFGSLGFVAIFDLFDPKRVRERAKLSWKSLQFGSKIALYFSIGLVLFGGIMICILELNNTLKGKDTMGILVTSLMQSVATRTAGFNAIDFHEAYLPTLITVIILMFIGASSSSTGGGIKTTTFALMLASAYATIRSKENTELFRRNITRDLVFRAYTIFFFVLSGNLLGVFLLSLTESHILNMDGRSIIDLAFEEVSAFSTVGLSTGITPMLSPAGKIIITATMFIGRIGTLTIAFAFVRESRRTTYKYADGHTMVG